MPRRPRLLLPGLPLHVIQRGNNRQPCFFNDNDRSHFLDHLRGAVELHVCALHAYVLMSNHVHLLLTPQDPGNVQHMMKSVAQAHAQYINWRYRRSGGLWEGRYKAAYVESETYLLTCHRYVELNPVRAGLADHPGQYRWSSYRCNGEGKENPLVTPHPLYAGLGHEGEFRRGAYRSLFGQPLSMKDLMRIRTATEAEFAIGTQAFMERIAAMGSDGGESPT
ncbi:transposase [Pseudoduganella sp. SL102]|uniref:transposase n=1 Tax=Pseudoduganella sp. SL102 TaxID=2995154 RepID=UPI00248B7BF5|nr:transposase [Pseudoduganella sp. SL102]WBS01748.1 transposase [Pseudoduganella sp. SL102]